MPNYVSTLLVWVVVFVVLFQLSLAAVVIYDLFAIRRCWRTVSDELYRLSVGAPVIGYLVTGIICLAAGMLIGHCFLGDRGEPDVKQPEIERNHKHHH